MAADFIRAVAAAGRAAGGCVYQREGRSPSSPRQARGCHREEMGLGRRGAEDGQGMRPWKAATSGAGRARGVGSTSGFPGDLITLIREVALWIPALLQVC